MPPEETQNISPSETKGESSTTSGETSGFATKKDVESSRNLLLGIMAGVVIFVVVTFWIEIIAVHRNYSQDKSVILQNNQLNKDYFDKVLLLNNEIQDLKTKIEVLKARNSYLK